MWPSTTPGSRSIRRGYFFRYGNPSWIVCDWEGVTDTLLKARETEETTVEQMALDHVRVHGRSTRDPAEVLAIAWEVGAFVFRDEHLAEPGLIALGVRSRHLQMLREVSTFMALNRVELDGTVSNVGPAWMFPIACQAAEAVEAGPVPFTLSIRTDRLEPAVVASVIHGEVLASG